MGNAHTDRIICPSCEKKFRDANALKCHMKAKRHDRVVGNATERDAAKRLRLQQCETGRPERMSAPFDAAERRFFMWGCASCLGILVADVADVYVARYEFGDAYPWMYALEIVAALSSIAGIAYCIFFLTRTPPRYVPPFFIVTYYSAAFAILGEAMAPFALSPDGIVFNVGPIIFKPGIKCPQPHFFSLKTLDGVFLADLCSMGERPTDPLPADALLITDPGSCCLKLRHQK